MGKIQKNMILTIWAMLTLHPAVTSGTVDLDLASVFIPDTSSVGEKTKTKRKRENNQGKCLTSASEIERRRQIQEEKERREEMKQNRTK